MDIKFSHFGSGAFAARDIYVEYEGDILASEVSREADAIVAASSNPADLDLKLYRLLYEIEGGDRVVDECYRPRATRNRREITFRRVPGLRIGKLCSEPTNGVLEREYGDSGPERRRSR